MRDVILLMGMGLDGVGADGWIPRIEDDVVAKAVSDDMWNQLEWIDTFLMGRRTFQLWESVWPSLATDAASSELQREFSRLTGRIRKVVFSKTLKSVSWENSRLVSGNIRDDVARMKHEPGKHMAIIGGPGIARTFSTLGLIDEYFLWIHPVILGKGKPLLGELDAPRGLDLIETKPFNGACTRLRLRSLGRDSR